MANVTTPTPDIGQSILPPWLQKWWPIRKVWAGGLAFVVAHILNQLAFVWLGVTIDDFVSRFGFSLSESGLAGAVAGAVAYLVPNTVRDKIRFLDNAIVKIAAESSVAPGVTIDPRVIPAPVPVAKPRG